MGKYSDREVYEALMQYSGEFFPSVDTIIDSIKSSREKSWVERDVAATDDYLADMHRAWAQK